MSKGEPDLQINHVKAAGKREIPEQEIFENLSTWERFYFFMKNFIKQHRYFILAFLVFVILAVVSGYQSLKITNYQSIADQLPISNFQNTSTNTATQNIINAPTAQDVQIEKLEQAEPLNNFNNTTTPQATSYKLQVTGTSTVYELMLNSQLNFKSKTFSGLGEFVEEINGLKNDAQTGKYWIYYINGESAKLGISQQTVKPNDIITWNYEKSIF